MNNVAEIPGYLAAVKRENDLRDAAMVDDLRPRLCGVEIRPMTLRHWVILDGVDSPFLDARHPVPQAEQVVQFLWILSPRFTPGASWRRGRFIRKCVKQVGRLDYGEIVVAIRQFVEDTFQDNPETDVPSRRGFKPPQVGFAAWVVHKLCDRYHWPEAVVFQMPLKRVFQYLKIMDMEEQAAKGLPAVGCNPSDKVRMDHIRECRKSKAAKINGSEARA